MVLMYMLEIDTYNKKSCKIYKCKWIKNKIKGLNCGI
jgi:hypothetical protein